MSNRVSSLNDVYKVVLPALAVATRAQMIPNVNIFCSMCSSAKQRKKIIKELESLSSESSLYLFIAIDCNYM